MRLTLRTLLAYLDRTLDKESSETLHGKVMESSFASQLIKRIKVSLSSPTLGAASPVAAGPVDEANVISEYLDSTLPNEQVAEIERACLESDPLLAEAAGCHQILTLVLGKPAEVSPALRHRIYELPNSDAFRALSAKENRPGLTGESFASLAIPNDSALNLGATDATAGFIQNKATDDTAIVGVLTSSRQQPMRPVGPSDSGVSDAPTRLRQAGLADDRESGRDANGKAIAASPLRKPGLSDLYGGTVRTSRITPWLVSLALAAVLLFALSRLFEPLLNPQTASLDDDMSETYTRVPADTTEPMSASQLSEPSLDPATQNPATQSPVSPEIDVPPEAAPPMLDVGAPAIADKTPTGTADVDETEMLPPPLATGVDVATVPGEIEPTGPQPIVPSQPETSQPETSQPDVAKPDMTQPDATQPEMASVTPENPDVSVASPATSDPDAPKMAEADPGAVAEVPVDGVAKLLTERTLLIAKGNGAAWQVIPTAGLVPANTEFVCAPTFRARLEGTDGLDLTMAGPTQLGFVRKDADTVLYMAGGRILLRHKTPGAVLNVSLSGRPVSIQFKNPDTLVAINLDHLRKPGADPLAEASRLRSATLMIVQGAAEITSVNAKNTLDTGQQLQIDGDSEPVQSAVTVMEDWIDEPDPNETSLESLARSGLLSMMSDTNPLELSLREAIPFRRAEVGALAARTLLRMGRGDVYFVGDGILNEVRQKAYWEDHYAALLAVVNQSVRSAEELRASISQSAAADGPQLFELLTGYSQEQLKGGADAKLVEMLDSPSMAVRVLALENLREITGTSLNYRADQENAIRRATDVKKWEARARKGDIRWPEIAAPAAAP